MGAAVPLVMLAVTAASAAASGVAASNAANYQAEVAKTNAQIAAQKQKYMVQDYTNRENIMAQQDKAKMGGLANTLAASGLNINDGSTKGVLVSEKQNLTTNRFEHHQAFMTDWYSSAAQKQGFEAQAKLDQMQASNDMTTGLLKAASSAIGGGYQIDKEYGTFSAMGVA